MRSQKNDEGTVRQVSKSFKVFFSKDKGPAFRGFLRRRTAAEGWPNGCKMMWPFQILEREEQNLIESNVADWDARPINAGSTATLLRAPDWPFAQAEKSTERIESNRRLFRILERFRPINLLSLAPALRISRSRCATLL